MANPKGPENGAYRTVQTLTLRLFRSNEVICLGANLLGGDLRSLSDVYLRIRFVYYFCGWSEDDSSLIFGAEMRCLSATEKSK